MRHGDVPKEKDEARKLKRAVAAVIRKLRGGLGLTQEELASRLETSGAWVANLEKGENVTLETLAKLARVLDTQIDVLLQKIAEEVAKTG